MDKEHSVQMRGVRVPGPGAEVSGCQARELRGAGPPGTGE
jgi:hypothetical protein